MKTPRGSLIIKEAKIILGNGKSTKSTCIFLQMSKRHAMKISINKRKNQTYCIYPNYMVFQGKYTSSHSLMNIEII